LENTQQVNELVDHLFRHEAGKMIAVLTRVFGFKNIEQAEDIVNDTMLRALETWKFGKLPENPRAWLYRAARNRAIDLLRRQQLKYKIDSDISYLLQSEYTLAPALHEMFTENEIKDSQLRMMFACCDEAFSPEVQITLILKTLGGLSTKEVANAFLSAEETISKRLYRTREKIRNENISLDYPGADAMPERLDTVLKALYLIFNEGYNSSQPEKLIREDLCEEAMRLCILLTENPRTNFPQTNALLALMCFHVSRFNARLDDKGMIVLLKDQDRSKWNKFLIERGNWYLECSSSGNNVYDFHVEAAIASLHANAVTYEKTDWKMIFSMYDTLLRRTANPMVALNRCVVLAEVEGYEKAIGELLKIKGLSENCYYHATLGDMHFKSGNTVKAKEYFTKALGLTTSNTEARLMQSKLQQFD
jgi:RNA polymerase sigma-70 factor (ECF subfamily)